jgi:hypothetical protein
MWTYYDDMKQTKGSETTIRITKKTKAIVEKVAAVERRSFKDQLAVLLEIGYAEYERRQKFLKDVESGKTQIEPGAFAHGKTESVAHV